MDENKEKEEQQEQENEEVNSTTPELNEEQKIQNLVDRINQIDTPEEFMDFMNSLSDDEKKLLSFKKEFNPAMQAKSKKPIWLLFKGIETVVSILILIALAGLIKPFNLKMPYGDLYYMGTIALSVFIFGFGLHFIRKPFVMIFYEVILDILVLACMIIFTYCLPFISFVTELDEALYIISFLSVKAILITFIKKYSEKFL